MTLRTICGKRWSTGTVAYQLCGKQLLGTVSKYYQSSEVSELLLDFAQMLYQDENATKQTPGSTVAGDLGVHWLGGAKPGGCEVEPLL